MYATAGRLPRFSFYLLGSLGRVTLHSLILIKFWTLENILLGAAHIANTLAKKQKGMKALDLRLQKDEGHRAELNGSLALGD